MRGDGDVRTVQFVLVFELFGLIYLVDDFRNGEGHRSTNSHLLDLLLGFLFFLLHLGLFLLLLGFFLFECGEFGHCLLVNTDGCFISFLCCGVTEDESCQDTNTDEDIDDGKNVSTSGFGAQIISTVALITSFKDEVAPLLRDDIDF